MQEQKFNAAFGKFLNFFTGGYFVDLNYYCFFSAAPRFQVSEDAGIEPRTVRTVRFLVLAERHCNNSGRSCPVDGILELVCDFQKASRNFKLIFFLKKAG
jgi:hypothetical protein